MFNEINEKNVVLKMIPSKAQLKCQPMTTNGNQKYLTFVFEKFKHNNLSEIAVVG